MNIGILLWNKCNASCAHCAVDSNPKEKAVMSDEDILRVIDECFFNDSNPSIGLSGGEAFIYFSRLKEFISYASKKGAQISVNTNCYWAKNDVRTKLMLQELIDVGLTKLVVSTDQFHTEYIPEESVIRVIKICKMIHLPVDLQFVSTKTTKRLSDFLGKYGDELLNIACREIPCHPVGQASKFDDSEFFTQRGVPQGLCPSAVLSVSASGNVIPCCNTAGHLQSLKIGDITQPLNELYDIFRTSSITQILCSDGPKAFIRTAVKSGYQVRNSGYVDQCHLCYDLFKTPSIAEAIKDYAATYMSSVVCSYLDGESCNEYKKQEVIFMDSH